MKASWDETSFIEIKHVYTVLDIQKAGLMRCYISSVGENLIAPKHHSIYMDGCA